MRIAASAPTRIDFAGGTIDIWPLYLFHDGAATLNAAISLRAQVTVEARSDEGLELRSLDTARGVSARSWAELDPTGQLPLLVRAARHYQIERVSVTTHAESPAGAGIAGASPPTIPHSGGVPGAPRAPVKPQHNLAKAIDTRR